MGGILRLQHKPETASASTIPSCEFLSSEKMSCCGGNCGCASGCNCGSGCGGCKMYADLYGERGTNTAGMVDLGAATQKGRIEGHEVADGSESGGCGCNKCNCGSSCSCACCGCN